MLIDLPNTVITDEIENILKEHIPKLRDIGMLFVDIELTKHQGENLVKLLEMAAKEHGAAPTPVFVGTDGQVAPPAGWRPFLSGMGFQQATARHVALATDLSGSMGLPVTPAYPQLVDHTLPQPNSIPAWAISNRARQPRGVLADARPTRRNGRV